MRKAGADMDDLFQSTLSMRRATVGLRSIHRGWLEFQSTLSMRRATPVVRRHTDPHPDFNPRSP